MISEDLKEVLINIVMLETHGNMQPVYVKIKGLEEGAMYKDMATNKIYPSEALKQIGMPYMPPMEEYASIQVKLLKVE